ncbi:thiol S-methyltransferase TMT1A-like [Palaemon carinicauda]|uniref:thiol S-methyltransferase TMT1A-like n=1 Tax=Palaemon carinicauda TaxID=392227 RepID=UPI0035B62287
MADDPEATEKRVEDLLMEEEEEEVLSEAGEEGGEETTSLINWIANNFVLIVALVIVLVVLKVKLKDWRRRWFAAFMNCMSQEVDVKRELMKKELFSSMSSVKSHDPELRKSGAIKVLEIGVGTGTNFAYYPEGTRLTVIDPNPHFKHYYNENRTKFPNIHSEDIIQTTGEEMDMIPDGSIDVVVVTLVFCSVENTEKILKNILRVLAPGGKFYLYEHIKEFDTKNHSIRGLLQTILTQSGIWPFLLDGCCLDRDMFQALENAGFSNVKVERFHADIDHFVFQLIAPSLKGEAEK